MISPNLKVVSSKDGNKSAPLGTDRFAANRSVYNAVKRFSLESLNDLIRVLMENVDDALFALSDKVDNDRERNMYFEAMREIRKKRDSLQKSFDYEMQRCIDSFASKRASTVDYDEDDELTLVEFDEMEDKIAINNMIKRARPQFEDDLFAVTERLKAVMRRKVISEDENPLDPCSICESFHTASELLETDIQVKLIFYKLFERFVMNNLGHFYRELNALFARNGVLPEFSADQERKKQTTRFMSNRIKNSAGEPVAPGGMTSGGPMYSPDPATNSGDGNLFATLQQAASSGAIPIAGATVAGQPGTPAGGPVSTGVQPAGIAAGTGGAAQDNGGFVAALTNLQTTCSPTQPLASIDPQNFKAATRQQLMAFRQQNQHQFTAADSQTIDVVSMLFDFFFDDEALPAPIKVLIGRLQIPFLKVAILDADFFNQKKHPARKLLDSISRASLGWGDNHKDSKGLIDKTEEIVNFLITEFGEDISVFEEAYIDFENFVNRESEKYDQNEAALRKQEQEKEQSIELAQNAAEALVGKLTRNRELSNEVTDFLETTWSSVLFNAYLSLGESSNHWRNLKRISTTFVWTLIPKHSEAERSKIIKTIPALLRALSRGMELINIKTEVQNRIFRVLAQEHAKIVKQTSRNIVTRVDDTTVWPEDAGARALARAEGIVDGEIPDFEFLADAAGGIEVVENEMDDDSITIIDATETNEVINDLNQFTIGVKQGKIRVDEEIVLGSAEGDDFGLFDGDKDEHFATAMDLEIGSWVEFSKSDSSCQVARLSWKSRVTGNLVFVNRSGNKVRNMTISGFADELRTGRVSCIESSSVFDRAIYTIMSRIQH